MGFRLYKEWVTYSSLRLVRDEHPREYSADVKAFTLPKGLEPHEQCQGARRRWTRVRFC